MKMTFIKSTALLLLVFLSFGSIAQKTLTFSPTDKYITYTVRKAIENISETSIKLVFKKGIYRFSPEYAIGKYSYITNHGNGYKRIAFLLERFKEIEIDGQGSEFIFHGQIAPFQIRNAEKIDIKNLTIDWDIPFCFQGEVVAVNAQEGWRELKPFTKGYSWEVKKGRLTFPNIGGFHFTELGSALAFDAKNKRVAHGEWDMSSRPEKVVKLANGNLKIYEKLKHYPAIGTVQNHKGPHEENRYAPAFQVLNSKNIIFNNITIHHALGMGFLCERSEDIQIKNSGVYVRKDSDRLVSSIADATHFANCKGEILIENSEFKHMLDDGTNVHGTYVMVDKIINANTVRIALQHFEQMGFEFAGTGDKIWFIKNPSPSRIAENTVTKVEVLNEQYTDLTFKNPLDKDLKEGDILENKTWNPEFTMRGCTIKDHRARNIIVKTPKKIVIENNNLSSMMSSILLRGETFHWFESGAVNDVLIQNNIFNYCAYSGAPHSVLRITPRLGKTFNKTETYDSNIRFINNTINTFDNNIVWADRVKGLIIQGNTITKTNTAIALHPKSPVFELINCTEVNINNNQYKGGSKNVVKADAATKKTLKVTANKGF